MIRLLRRITNQIRALPHRGGIRDATCRLAACAFGGGEGSRSSQHLLDLELTVSDIGRRLQVGAGCTQAGHVSCFEKVQVIVSPAGSRRPAAQAISEAYRARDQGNAHVNVRVWKIRAFAHSWQRGKGQSTSEGCVSPGMRVTAISTVIEITHCLCDAAFARTMSL